ncbi:hypothetical protein [Lacticaseibacillus yichunensis]|uniref:Uncharacterized protein n=1 Tax=Lacticaseibacillus yichunensis TaxID=2486015 RepID=A0ABW4CNQ1_9LACO|nr:hypothetical protein [Lacticaseibacillus yichunensis]
MKHRKKSAIKKKHRRMMQAREDNEAAIKLTSERKHYGGKMTLDELIDSSIHLGGDR